ncbi:MAG: hypothetical protein M5U26_15620 [Planctomycetota bacterium]|nr:hypothetical protein [Planctomycetota bacterium]
MSDSSSLIDIRPLTEMGARCASCRCELVGECYQSEGFPKPVCKTCYNSHKVKQKTQQFQGKKSAPRKSAVLPQLKSQARDDLIRPLVIGGTVLLLAALAWYLTR